MLWSNISLNHISFIMALLYPAHCSFSQESTCKQSGVVSECVFMLNFLHMCLVCFYLVTLYLFHWYLSLSLSLSFFILFFFTNKAI